MLRSPKSVLLLSGPNLDILGERETEVYGEETLEEHVSTARLAAAGRGLTLEHLHSNAEHVLVEAIHDARRSYGAIVINPAAFTHYSWAIHDALAAFDGPVVEVHLSNPAAREQWRQTSVVSSVATGTITGFGRDGYRLAVEAVATILET